MRLVEFNKFNNKGAQIIDSILSYGIKKVKMSLYTQHCYGCHYRDQTCFSMH